MQELSGQKLLLRKEFTQARNQISEADAEHWSMQACLHAISLLHERDCKKVMVYVPFRSELNVWPIINWCWEHHIEVLVPKCEVETSSMHIYTLYSKDQLKAGAYQILEPDPNKTTLAISNPDIVLVPGLAYTEKGGRLGYGGGYYDRYYERMVIDGQAPIWAGIGYHNQLTAYIPMDKYDINLNIIITNKGITMCS